MALDVFICHCARDQAIADVLCAEMEAGGVMRCWKAPRDVPAGGDWESALIRAVWQCKIFLLIHTAASNESPLIRRLVGCARELVMPVLSLRAEPLDIATELAPLLTGARTIDASDGAVAGHLPDVAAALKNLLANIPEPETARPAAGSAYSSFNAAALLRDAPASASSGAYPQPDMRYMPPSTGERASPASTPPLIFARPAPPAPPARLPRRRRLIRAAIAGVGLIALGMCGIIVLQQHRTGPQPADAAPLVGGPATGASQQKKLSPAEQRAAQLVLQEKLEASPWVARGIDLATRMARSMNVARLSVKAINFGTSQSVRDASGQPLAMALCRLDGILPSDAHVVQLVEALRNQPNCHNVDVDEPADIAESGTTQRRFAISFTLSDPGSQDASSPHRLADSTALDSDALLHSVRYERAILDMSHSAEVLGITLTRVRADAETEHPTRRRTDGFPVHRTTITIEGVAQNDAIVTSFAGRLQQISAVDELTGMASSPAESRTRLSRRFEITLALLDVARSQTTLAAPARAPSQPGRADAQAAARSLKVGAISSVGGVRVASINNQICSEGQTIEKCLVERINADSVQMRCGNFRFQLKITGAQPH